MTTKHKVMRAHLQEWLAYKGNKEKRGIKVYYDKVADAAVESVAKTPYQRRRS